MDSEITNPIILIGSGRCGSTALHELLSSHPNVAWLSDLCDRFPGQPRYNQWLMRSLDLPLVGRVLKRRFSPGENYIFWEHHAPGFRRPFRDLTARDVTNKEKRAVHQAMLQMRTRQRDRPLIKITGWPRILYLQELFPDARFIHIVRDGRAVANSMLAADFWDGWLGPDRWRWGNLGPEQARMWAATGSSFVGLAGFQWVAMQEAVIAAKALLSSHQFLEIRYEDFCQDKLAVAKQIAQFAQLAWTRDFERNVQRFAVESQNFKWQVDLTIEQQKILENVEYKYLQYYGYVS